MSINTELMQQVVANLNANKEFKQKSEKIIKCDNQRDKITKVEKVLGGVLVGGTGVSVGGLLASFEPSNEIEETVVYAGAGILCASLAGVALCEEIKERIKSKSTDLYNDVYSQVSEDYIARVRESKENYTEKDYLHDIAVYQYENEKMFNIVDFESDCME